MNLVDTLGERLVAAIAAQDEAAIAACFAEDAEFRALSPPGLRERSAGADVGALIAMWFGDSTVLEVAETQTMQIGDRLRISYRFTGIENDEPFVVEQHLFCTVRDGRIAQADLLCSGFRPPPGG
jgi:ketosteroid isomerase-like protein